MKRNFFVPPLVVAIMMVFCLSQIASADTAVVPSNYSTIQAAVDAVAGTADATVVINSNDTFDETVTITSSVTIEAGQGYTPTIKGAASIYTIFFNPTADTVQNLTLKRLTLLPPTNPYYIVYISNSGTAAASILIDEMTLLDPAEASPTGIRIGSTPPASNNVVVRDTTITLGESPATHWAIDMQGKGSLTVSGAVLNKAGIVVQPQPEVIDSITVENSTCTIAALPNVSPVIVSLNNVTSASVRNTTFKVQDYGGNAGGIRTTSGIGTITLDSNRFLGSGQAFHTAINIASAIGDNTTLIATNNVASNLTRGILLYSREGSFLDASVINNTFDTLAWEALNLSANDPDTTIHARLFNNIYSNVDRAVSDSADTSSTIEIEADHNLYFNEAFPDSIKGPNSRSGDPMYTDAAGGDFTVAFGSPAIDAGGSDVAGLPAEDLAGNSRSLDGDGDGEAIVDMGAFEYVDSDDDSSGSSGSCFIETMMCGDS